MHYLVRNKEWDPVICLVLNSACLSCWGAIRFLFFGCCTDTWQVLGNRLWKNKKKHYVGQWGGNVEVGHRSQMVGLEHMMSTLHTFQSGFTLDQPCSGPMDKKTH